VPEWPCTPLVLMVNEKLMLRSDYVRSVVVALAAGLLWALIVASSSSWAGTQAETGIAAVSRISIVAMAGIVGALLAAALRPTVIAVCERVEISVDEAALGTKVPVIVSGVVWGVVSASASTPTSSPHAALVFLALVLPWIAWIDQRVQRIPSALAYLAAGGTAAMILLTGVVHGTWGAVGRALLAGPAAGVVFFALAVLLRGGIGIGDARLTVSLAMVLGYVSWTALPAALVFSILTAFVGVIVARVLRAIRSEPARSHIALGPYLVLGTALAFVAS
jgi:leader peptidase (prepilin peptidase)/N-methyltransferase